MRGAEKVEATSPEDVGDGGAAVQPPKPPAEAARQAARQEAHQKGVWQVKQTYLPHLAARVFGVPLMVQIDKLMVILDAIGPRIGLREHVVVEGLPVVVTRPAPDDQDEEDDMPMAGRKPYPVSPDGIAVITISGTLVKKASWMDAESGLQSYETIRGQIADARDDPGIRGVLLDVDSPGGEVGGLFDLADEVYALRESKPCYAIANDEAFSAAYALASSAQRLFVTRTGGVGSIGVIAVHMDQSGWDEKMGRKYTAIYAGARKNDFSTHQPLSDDARANLQGEVDRLYEMFVASVSRNRGITPALVRKTDAGLYWGEKAISAGLADQVGSFDDALAAVTQASRASRQARATASAEAQIEERERRTYGSTHRNETGRRSGSRRRARRNETCCGGPGSGCSCRRAARAARSGTRCCSGCCSRRGCRRNRGAHSRGARGDRRALHARWRARIPRGSDREAHDGRRRFARRCSRARPRSRRARRSIRRWMALRSARRRS